MSAIAETWCDRISGRADLPGITSLSLSLASVLCVYVCVYVCAHMCVIVSK